MRILHVLDHSIPLQTGYALRTQSILRQQRAFGLETFQLTGPRQGPAPPTNEEQIDGWHFYRTPPPGGLLEGVPVFEEIERIGEISYRIERIARRMRPNILHAHSPVLNAISALRVGRRLNMPVVYEVRALWEDAAVNRGSAREGGLRYRLIRSVETWAFKRVDEITTISEELRADIIARGIPKEKVTVVPDAVEIGDFRADRVPCLELKRQLGLDGSLVLGFFGSFHDKAGIQVLLRALPQVLAKCNEVRLLLIGDGPLEAQIRQLATELGIAEKLVFAGRVSPADSQRYLDLVDILLYPDLSTRQTELVTPFDLLLAMARGSLLAASDVGGHRQLIRHGETGVLFKPDDTVALASAILGLIFTPESWPALKGAARRFVEVDRNPAAIFERYGNVYGRVTQSPSQQ